MPINSKSAYTIGLENDRHKHRPLWPCLPVNCEKVSHVTKNGSCPNFSLRLKYTKFDFGWGSVPDPAGGA